MTANIARVPAFVLFAAVLASCGEEPEGDVADLANRDAGLRARDAAIDAAPTPLRDAAMDSQVGSGGRDAGTSTRCDSLVEPFERAGAAGLVVARFVAIDPELVYRGRYDWSFELHNPSGEAIGDAELKAKAFMPAHGHGTSTIKLRHSAGSARYDLLAVNLFMAGKWELTLTVRTSAGEDRIVFRACPKELPDAGEPDAGDDAGEGASAGHH